MFQVLNVTVRVMKRDHDRKAGFHPRPYFRLFVTWLLDFNSSDSTLDSSNFQVLREPGLLSCPVVVCESESRLFSSCTCNNYG